MPLCRRCRLEWKEKRLLMPVRPEFRPLYPANWRALSRQVRFERAGGRCQACRRPHLARVRCLPDGRWFDETAATWRDRRGRPARWPDLIEMANVRTTRVVLAAAHLDNDPANNRLINLKGLCQRCHILHDRPFHLAQRWLTYRRRWAMGDLFHGVYGVRTPLADLVITAYGAGYTVAHARVGAHASRTGAYAESVAGLFEAAP
jgi:hypothetical protein